MAGGFFAVPEKQGLRDLAVLRQQFLENKLLGEAAAGAGMPGNLIGGKRAGQAAVGQADIKEKKFGSAAKIGDKRRLDSRSGKNPMH